MSPSLITKKMQNINEVFKIQRENQKELKALKKEYKENLADANDYEETCEQIAVLREKKKQIETLVQGKMTKQFERIDELTGEIKAEKEMISDIAITTIMGGETVEATDEFGNTYGPEIKVNLKKEDKIFKH